ncbi:hypothetical protein [Cytobacillus praedii]
MHNSHHPFDGRVRGIGQTINKYDKVAMASEYRIAIALKPK